MFGLAWYEGQFLKSEPPRFNISYLENIDLRLLEIAQMIGYDLDFEISSLVQQMPEVIDRIRLIAGMPLVEQKAPEYCEHLEGIIRGFTTHPDPAIKQMAATAFACGIIYCRNVVYPGGTSYGKASMETWSATGIPSSNARSMNPASRIWWMTG